MQLCIVFATLAATLHVFICYLEMFAWTSALARKTFGTTSEFASKTRELAANQGLYNLMLAIIVFVGVVCLMFYNQKIGLSLIFAGCGSMSAAAIYLFVTSPDKRAAAIKQGVSPILAVVTALLIIY